MEEAKREGFDAVNIKCACGKIISQRKDRVLVIKCRHCKRLVLIHLDDLSKIEYR